MSGAESKSTELTLHMHGEWQAIQTLLGICEPSSPHQSCNSRPPQSIPPFKLLPLHFAAYLLDTITNSVEMESSFIFTNREISHGILISPSFLTCDSDFLSLTSFSCPYAPTSTRSSTFALIECLRASIMP